MIPIIRGWRARLLRCERRRAADRGWRHPGDRADRGHGAAAAAAVQPDRAGVPGSPARRRVHRRAAAARRRRAGARGALVRPRDVPRNPLPPQAAGDDVLVALARLIRALHEASAGWVPPPGAVWGGTPATTGPVTERPELVSHRDYYPGNVVFRDGLPVALIDFDLAMPT